MNYKEKNQLFAPINIGHHPTAPPKNPVLYGKTGHVSVLINPFSINSHIEISFLILFLYATNTYFSPITIISLAINIIPWETRLGNSPTTIYLFLSQRYLFPQRPDRKKTIRVSRR